MGINNGLMFSNNPSGFNGPSTNGVSGQILFGQGTTGTPIWSPGSSLGIIAASITQNYFNGYMGTSGIWTCTGASYQVLTNTGGNTLATVFQNGITVVAAGSSLCGIVFVPQTASSVYEITCLPLIVNGTASDEIFARLTDGSTPFAWTGYQGSPTSGTVTTQAPLTGFYAASSGNTVTISIQGGTNAGTATFGGSISFPIPFGAVQWRVLQIF